MHSWKDGIKIDLNETVSEGADLILLTHDRNWWRAFLNTAMKLRIP
jgi:hypothetical protein